MIRAQAAAGSTARNQETLNELAPDALIAFERVAVTPKQIAPWHLPTRPTKQSDTRSKSFGEVSNELDAIEPDRLRELVQAVIETHFPPGQFAILKAGEADERRMIAGLLGMMQDGSAP